MSAQQPPAQPTQKPTPTAQKKSLGPLLDQKPQLALALIGFLQEDPPRTHIVVDGTSYNLYSIRREVYLWTTRHRREITTPFRSEAEFKNPEFLKQLYQETFNALIKAPEQYGAQVPSELKELTAVYIEHLDKLGNTGEGIKTSNIPTAADFKMLVKMALENQKRLQAAANLSDEKAHVIKKSSEEILQRILKQADELPDQKILKEIIKAVKKEVPEATLINTKRATLSLQVLTGNRTVTKGAVSANNELQKIYNLERGTKAGLKGLLAKQGLDPTKIGRIPKFLESLPPNMPKEEMQEKLQHYFRINHPAELAKRGLSPREFVLKNLAAFETFIQHSPLTVQKDRQGESLHPPTAAIIKQANDSGDSPTTLTAYTYGITPQVIEQELQRKDLSIAEKKRLRELQQDLNNIINREKTASKLKEEIKEARKKTAEYCRTNKLFAPDNPNRISFFRPPAEIAKLSPAEFKKQAVAYLKPSLRGVQKISVGLFGRLPNLTKVPALKRFGLIKKFSLKYWKKRAAFGIARRVVGGFLIRSSKKGWVSIGRTIVGQGFRKGIIRGARIFRFLAKLAVKEGSKKAAGYIAGIVLGIATAFTSTVATVALIAKDVLKAVLGKIKGLLGFRKDKGLPTDPGALAADLIRRPLSFINLRKWLSPKTYLPTELQVAIDPLGRTVLYSVIIVMVLLVYFVVFSPLNSAFVAYKTAYKIGQGIASIIEGLKNIGSITIANANDELRDFLASIGFSQESINKIVRSAVESGNLQCGILAQAIMSEAYPDKYLPIFNAAADYYGFTSSDFRPANDPSEIQGIVMRVLQPTSCPEGKSTQDCEEIPGCCGHTNIAIFEPGNSSGTAIQAFGDTGRVEVVPEPHPSISGDFDGNEWLVPT